MAARTGEIPVCSLLMKPLAAKHCRMITDDKTVHWDPYLQHEQQSVLDSLSEEDRQQTAFMFRTGNVASHFYNESTAEPTEEDFIDWLTGLHADIATRYRQEGFEKHRLSLPLRRHAAERNDMGFEQYMKTYLTEQDYARWEKVAGDK